MTITPRHEHGNFCWVDLGTKDTQGAKRFYGELFGWSFEDAPSSPDMAYTMVKLNGKQVAGLFEEPMPNVPPHWTSYVSVKNADEIAERVKKNGGKLMGPPGVEGAFDVSDVGRMALFQDPTGAILGIWQPKKHTGADVYDVPGSLTWNECLTNNPQKAKDFYTQVFGWKLKEEATMHYTLFMQGDPEYHVGGLMQIDPKWGPVPPNWAVYFQVEDADKTCEKTKKLGGRVMMPPMDIENVGRFAWMMDPQGGMFAVIKSFPRK
jgi:predicted enzyme related to lactoylglutathione lyase